MKPQFLIVGGFDPSGCAGVLADLRVFERHRAQCHVALTAVTAQSRDRFLAWEAVAPKLFAAQLAALSTPIFGVKIGMLATEEHARILLNWLKRNAPKRIVWDPVLRATHGATLFRIEADSPTLRRLLRTVHVVTPNVPEAEWLLRRKITSLEEMKNAAQALQKKMGKGNPRVVVLKGGHSATGPFAIDVAVDGRDLREYRAKRRPGTARGTGCHFASTLLWHFSRESWDIAIRKAKASVLERVILGAQGI